MAAVRPSRQFLYQRTAQELIQDTEMFNLVTVKEGESIAKAIETLTVNKISSAPVVSKDSDTFIGSIDVVDLVWFACCKMNIQGAEVYTTKRQAEQFQKPLTAAILNISGRNAMTCIRYDRPMMEVVALLANPNTHRIYVRNEVGDYVGLITQSALLQYLNKHQEVFGDLLQKAVLEIFNENSAPQQVKAVSMHNSVIDALEVMVDNDISGVAVLDDKGKMVGNISAGDIKRMQLWPPIQLTYDLFEPISVFSNLLTESERRYPQEEKLRKQLQKFRPQYVRPNDPLKKVLSKIEDNRIHRVYVVEEDMTPRRVISLGDVIGLLK